MPGEDTIEIIKLRNVQGQLTDLPTDNPRATLSSRIRALLLKATEIPQLQHLYGALELNKTVTFDTGENTCRGIFSDGTYLYTGLYTSPGRVVKVDLDGFIKEDTLTFNSGENNCNTLFSDGTYLYAGLETTPAKIIKINLASFTEEDSLTLDAGENLCRILFSDGTYLYAGLYTSPAKIVKIRLSDFTKDNTLTLSTDEDYCVSLYSDGNHLYAGLETDPAKIVKIDLFEFTEDSPLILDTAYTSNKTGWSYGESKMFESGSTPAPYWSYGESSLLHEYIELGGKTSFIFADGTYLYVGLYVSPAKIVKIRLSDFIKVDILTLDTGENLCRGLFSDGTYLYVGLETDPAKIVKIDLSSFTKITTITLDVGESNCYTLFSDGTYIYASLSTSPGKVARRYILPSGATLRERKTDEIYKQNVEVSSPLMFCGKVDKHISTVKSRVTALSGWGDAYFRNWYLYVVRDAGGVGAAPQGEKQPISDYSSDDGIFTHTTFTTPLSINDEVTILHPELVTGEAADAVWDEATAGHVTAGTFGKEIQDIKTETDKIQGDETEGTAAALDLTAVAGGTSGENGADVFTISTTTRMKIQFLGVSMANCQAGAIITVRMYTKVLDADVALTKFYSQPFTQGTDGDLIPAIDGTKSIRNDLRIEMHSNNAGDNAVAVPYFWIEEESE